MNSLKSFGVAVCLFVGTALYADDIVQIHGFGGWSYGKSSELTFFHADEEGNSKSAQFALNLSARPYERMSIVAQMNFDNAREEVDLDYAFVEWQATEHIALRAGRVKHPLGLYGEVFDVGTVRPFQSLPGSIYGPIGFTAKAYNGVGLTGQLRAGSWEFQYDAYAGQIDGDYAMTLPSSTVPDPNASPWRDTGFNYNDVIGGRLQVTTPVNGLVFGASGYSATDNFTTSTSSRKIDRTVYLGSAEYAHGPLTLRAEVGKGVSEKTHEHAGKYVEASYRIGQKWQVAGRWEALDVEVPAYAAAFAGPMATVLEHKERAIGVNYWFNPNFVVRTEYHTVDGNRFAHAATNREFYSQLASGKLVDTTNVIVLGAQFSF
jgi:hypothetical protein